MLLDDAYTLYSITMSTNKMVARSSDNYSKMRLCLEYIEAFVDCLGW